MGKTDTEQLQLSEQLEQAQALIEIGAQYRHFKAADKIYTVLCLAFQEADNEICVIYRAEYGEGLVFARPLASWLQEVESDGEVVQRFTKL